MKKTTPLLVLTAFLLVGCGGGGSTPAASSATSAATSEATSAATSEVTSAIDTSVEESSQATSEEGTSEAGTSAEETSEAEETSSAASSSKESSSSSKESSSAATYSSDAESTSFDPEGLVEVAYAENGDELTDWTDEMRAILAKHLGANYVPPFFPMSNLRVSYDDLEILQVRGDSRTGIISDYETLLNKNGFASYVDQDEGGKTHIYGRLMDLTNGVLISLDGLDANGIFSINFEKDVATSTWPAEGIAQVMAEEYESQYTLPAYAAPGVSYIIEEDIMSNLYIYCMGAPSTSPTEYKKILEDNLYTVVEMTEQGMPGYYTATSRDKKIIVVFYYDGTGLQITTTHGEGETYTTWEDCLYAIDDFGQVELGINGFISTGIPAIPDAATYSIDRSVRGKLSIVAHKESSFTRADLNKYRNLCAESFDIDDTKGDGEDIWILAKDKSFAMTINLQAYYTDLGEYSIDDFVINFYDYKIYEGYYVYYGTWPSAQVQTVANNISKGLEIPSYDDANATYYCYSNYFNLVKVEVAGVDSNALEDYKATLKAARYSVAEEENSFVAIDRNEVVKITASQSGNKLVIEITNYVKSTATDGSARISFANESQITELNKSSLLKAVWSNDPVTFTLDNNGSSKLIGNYGDYISNPLRVYTNQKITIVAAEAKIIKVEFYVEDPIAGGRIATGFDSSNLASLTAAGFGAGKYDSKNGIVTFEATSPADQFEITIGSKFVGLAEVEVFYEA